VLLRQREALPYRLGGASPLSSRPSWYHDPGVVPLLSGWLLLGQPSNPCTCQLVYALDRKWSTLYWEADPHRTGLAAQSLP
jgi:hypothetical protein